jgi:hypothetical protein
VARSHRLQINEGSLTVAEATEAAEYLHHHFTLVPESFGLKQFIRKIQEHPYSE